MNFAVKIVNQKSNRMLNICDAELVGRTVRQSDLDITITKSYYGDRIIDEKEAESLLRTSSIINMVGKKTIDLSIKIGIGSAKGVKEIEGVPFLIVFKF
ncbi:DUF424 domain-containing protein [Candidatus Nitrosotalea okcheonensis]|uniref:DUF424 domain-containing protein n=1 Tax=Candidatus Nitrosotalea okcheonensis TaxID=1903276 RepID=A0A2H1FFT2_9ARCH|nr:DUF424 family protein [Candidatus Nitrosotalea okcheonensis]SMH71631.1 conserved protein of unknown function [Candidatus Nitrosotalea okcheonensis]